ncbi:hypothetical protein N9877_05190 [Flavobacteriaceae bacterium]|nr:hypothetical protein [Flavobacteriaceae bacterium]
MFNADTVKINASAPGLKRIKGSKYNLFPGKGREVKINVSGTLPDGNKVSSVSSFRIKDIPKPKTKPPVIGPISR